MQETTHETIEHEAATWAARTLSGNMLHQEIRELEAWIARAPENREAYEAYSQVISRTEEAGLHQLENEFRTELEALANSDSLLPRGMAFFSAQTLSALAATLVICISAIVWFAGKPASSLTYQTARGERIEVSLPDGSIAALNTDSNLTVSMNNNTRRIKLSKGEAVFDVVRDANRPFIVSTAAADVLVTGTRFSVDARAGEAVVSVLSGIVRVAASNRAPTEAQIISDVATTLLAGQQVTVSDAGKISATSLFEPDKIVGWRSGNIYFEELPLRDVVAELNRYFTTRIELDDGDIGDALVTGRFDLDDQGVAIDALCAALDLRPVAVSGQAVRLYAQD